VLRDFLGILNTDNLRPGMIPIYEQGDGRGIGLTVAEFKNRFENICSEHIQAGRAKTFAIIFYDFNDVSLRKILKDRGVFTKLDRLAGATVSIFYLHSARHKTVDAFNRTFLSQLGVQENVEPPCVVFFKLSNDQIEHISVAKLTRASEMHGFHELHSVVQEYVERGELKESPGIKWIKSKLDYVATALFKEGLRRLLDLMF
jgi:hypothetical protein